MALYVVLFNFKRWSNRAPASEMFCYKVNIGVIRRQSRVLKSSGTYGVGDYTVPSDWQRLNGFPRRLSTFSYLWRQSHGGYLEGRSSNVDCRMRKSAIPRFLVIGLHMN